MKYLATKYNTELVIEADYFRLVHGHKEITSGLSYSGGTNVYDWQDAVFYRNGDENPVAFVQQPYSVTEVAPEVSKVTGPVELLWEGETATYTFEQGKTYTIGSKAKDLV